MYLTIFDIQGIFWALSTNVKCALFYCNFGECISRTRGSILVFAMKFILYYKIFIQNDLV